MLETYLQNPTVLLAAALAAGFVLLVLLMLVFSLRGEARRAREETAALEARLSASLDRVRESGSEALSHAQREISVRVEDARAFADRIRKRADEIASRTNRD